MAGGFRPVVIGRGAWISKLILGLGLIILSIWLIHIDSSKFPFWYPLPTGLVILFIGTPLAKVDQEYLICYHPLLPFRRYYARLNQIEKIDFVTNKGAFIVMKVYLKKRAYMDKPCFSKQMRWFESDIYKLGRVLEPYGILIEYDRGY
jgi:hypothetical protein